MNRKRTGIFWTIDSETLREMTKNSNSIAEICRKLGISCSGAQHKGIKKALKERGIDFSHIKIGLNSNSGRKFPNSNRINLDDILVENSKYNVGKNLKKRLFEEKLLKEKCSKCGLGVTWQKESITLQIDHINGNHQDNRIKNLRILCPNCHSQTKTFGGRNLKKVYLCKNCNKNNISKNSELCISCSNLDNRKIKNRPDIVTLQEQIKELGYVKTGKFYNVSDNTIRKWINHGTIV